MSAPILVKTYAAPPFDEREILRYAGSKEEEGISELLHSCMEEIKDKLVYKVCFQEFPLQIEGDSCHFEAFSCRSKGLAQCLNGCERVIIFAATVGIEIDRFIEKYSLLSPSRAVLMQAIGTERVEALCDIFCKDMQKEKGGLTSRFSPGYGDLSLQVQKEVASVLDCAKKIGVYLNESMLMSPSKSVTAFVGLVGQVRVE